MIILFVGDIHCAQFSAIGNNLSEIELKGLPKPEAIFLLGDVGFYGSCFKYYVDGVAKYDYPQTWFIDGNHEDHEYLDDLLKNWKVKNLTYIKRGTTVEVGGTKVLGIGGAKSADMSLCRDIADEDIEQAMSQGMPDIIISHECPAGIGIHGSAFVFNKDSTLPVMPGDLRLTKVMEYHKPKFWFFGHHHVWFETRIGNTKLVGLPEGQNGSLLFDTETMDYCSIYLNRR